MMFHKCEEKKRAREWEKELFRIVDEGEYLVRRCLDGTIIVQLDGVQMQGRN